VQGGLVPFEVGVPVVGDVTIAVWFGKHNLGERLHARPAFAYAFHTAFLGDGIERVHLQQLDVFETASLPVGAAAQAAFFMDMTFEDADLAQHPT
jgi:hypothetical protein